MTRRRKFMVAVLGAGLFVMGFVIGRGFKIAQDGFYRFFLYPHRYIECEPEVLLPYLKDQFGLAVPPDGESILTAHTWGTLDSSDSGFLVRFITRGENIEEFQMSLGVTITWKDYDAASDKRKTHWSTPPPPWFTTGIDNGKIGEGSDIHIYIDRTWKDKATIYCHGIYARPEEDFQSAYEGN